MIYPLGSINVLCKFHWNLSIIWIFLAYSTKENWLCGSFPFFHFLKHRKQQYDECPFLCLHLNFRKHCDLNWNYIESSVLDLEARIAADNFNLFSKAHAPQGWWEHRPCRVQLQQTPSRGAAEQQEQVSSWSFLEDQAAGPKSGPGDNCIGKGHRCQI